MQIVIQKNEDRFYNYSAIAAVSRLKDQFGKDNN